MFFWRSAPNRQSQAGFRSISAFFWHEYANKQVKYYIPPITLSENAASSRIKGIDLDEDGRINYSSVSDLDAPHDGGASEMPDRFVDIQYRDLVENPIDQFRHRTAATRCLQIQP
jgi:hypothetical protein